MHYVTWKDVFISFPSLVSKIKWLMMTQIQLSSEYHGLAHPALENYQVTETLKLNLSISQAHSSREREKKGLLCMKWTGSFFLFPCPKPYQNKAVRRQSASVKLCAVQFWVLTPWQSSAVLSWVCFGTGSRISPRKGGGDSMPQVKAGGKKHQMRQGSLPAHISQHKSIKLLFPTSGPEAEFHPATGEIKVSANRATVAARVLKA